MSRARGGNRLLKSAPDVEGSSSAGMVLSTHLAVQRNVSNATQQIPNFSHGCDCAQFPGFNNRFESVHSKSPDTKKKQGWLSAVRSLNVPSWLNIAVLVAVSAFMLMGFVEAYEKTGATNG